MKTVAGVIACEEARRASTAVRTFSVLTGRTIRTNRLLRRTLIAVCNAQLVCWTYHQKVVGLIPAQVAIERLLLGCVTVCARCTGRPSRYNQHQDQLRLPSL